MAQAYSNPKRANDPYALPDVEMWQDEVWEVECRCGVYEIPEPADADEIYCPSCERKIDTGAATAGRKAWFYWFCFPGCLPDSDPAGPFGSEAEALADAQEGYEDDDE